MTTSNDQKTKVLVTGFGPFGEHKVNASWVSVQELKKQGIGDNVELVISEIPVDYDEVGKIVPELWETEKPKLVVHVGVSSHAKKITIEQQAHNDGYTRGDVKGSCPKTNCCIDGGDNCVKSDIQMNCVCDEINSASIKAEAEVSHDPGRYLCDFAYYTSLHKDRSRSAFIHVPPLNTPYTAEEIAEGLKVAILSMIKQLS